MRAKYEYFSIDKTARAYLYRNLSEEMPIEFEKTTPLLKNNGSFSRAAVQGKKFKKSKATDDTNINSYQTLASNQILFFFV